MTDSVVCNCLDLSVGNHIAICISILSLIAAVANVILYFRLQGKYNAMVKIQTETGQGALETQVRSAIAEAYYNLIEISVMVAKEPGNEFLVRTLKGTEEIYLNAYEDACGKYIDSKIDKERFKKMYHSEIRRLVEEEPYKSEYATEQSPYHATKKVYREWYNLE